MVSIPCAIWAPTWSMGKQQLLVLSLSYLKGKGLHWNQPGLSKDQDKRSSEVGVAHSEARPERVSIKQGLLGGCVGKEFDLRRKLHGEYSIGEAPMWGLIPGVWGLEPSQMLSRGKQEGERQRVGPKTVCTTNRGQGSLPARKASSLPEREKGRCQQGGGALGPTRERNGGSKTQP